MSRFKTYAVVEKETGEVIGSFLRDAICDRDFQNVNDIIAQIYLEDKIVSTKTVFLSSTKGNIEKSRSSDIFYLEGPVLVSK